MPDTPHDITITMPASELEMRHNSGSRYRLVAMPFMMPSAPPKVGGRWPLITAADYTDDNGPRQVLIETEALPGEGYEAYPNDKVVVIPVNPAASQTQQRQAATHA
jgi:hypothetical protein